MEQKTAAGNLALALILFVFLAVNSYAQTVQREQLQAVEQKLDQYKLKQVTIATGAFSLRDYYKGLGLDEIEIRHGQIGVLVDETIQDASAIQGDIARNLDNYENVRIQVRNRLSELRNTHNLAQRRLNETVQLVREIRPTIQRPQLLPQGDEDALLSASYLTPAVLHYSNETSGFSRVITPEEIKTQLARILADLPAGGTAIIGFNQTAQLSEPPTDLVPECTLRLQYAVDAVTGLDTVDAGSLLALGGLFPTALPSCMFRIGGTFFYNIEPARKSESSIYCALPPGVSGDAEVWVIGSLCRESERVGFVIGG